MSATSDEIVSLAVSLPEDERARIIEAILSSFDAEERTGIDELWASAAESRIDAFERGDDPAEPAFEAIEEIELRSRK